MTTTEHAKKFVVQHENGQSYLGRYSLSQTLSFVPFAFAYVYDTVEAAETVMGQQSQKSRVIEIGGR